MPAWDSQSGLWDGQFGIWSTGWDGQPGAWDAQNDTWITWGATTPLGWDTQTGDWDSRGSLWDGAAEVGWDAHPGAWNTQSGPWNDVPTGPYGCIVSVQMHGITVRLGHVSSPNWGTPDSTEDEIWTPVAPRPGSGWTEVTGSPVEKWQKI